MRLGGEVDDGINAMLAHDATHEIRVADVAVHECVAGMTVHIAEIIRIAGIAEGVQIDHPRLLALQEQPHEMRADKPRSARH